MAYKGFPFSASNYQKNHMSWVDAMEWKIRWEMNLYFVSFLKIGLQKRINLMFKCQGKPLGCIYYKYWSADQMAIE